MVEWLTVWGVYTVTGFAFKEVLVPLAKGALEDYVKDFFKDSIKDFTGLFQKDTLKEVVGKALTEFLQLVQQELEDADLSQEQLKQYEKSLNEFIHNKSVKPILGSAFNEDCQGLEAKQLTQIWYQLNLSSLPDDFDWERVGKRYLKKVKALIRESDELRAILDSQNLESIQKNTQELAGIAPEFDLSRYQEGIRERYGNLNLDSLDTSVYDYREKLKVWQVFVAQNVRECQEYLPQVYEIPKEHQRRLRESDELEAEINPEEWERYKQVYYQQPVRSVLDVVNEILVDPPQPSFSRGENLDSSQALFKRREKLEPSQPLLKNRQNSEPPLKRGAGGIDSCRYVVILGDPGSGKSILLQYIALNWARTPLNNVIEQPIPLLIELRTYTRDRNSGQCKDFLEFFHKGSVICRLNQHQLHEQLKAGKVLVMFDGLDEVFDPAQREEVITDIHRFTNDYPNVRVIVTSRIIGYKPQRLRDAQFRHFMLQDLESEQIQDFIYRWHELTFTDDADKVRKRERLQHAIKTSSAIGELAGNPLLLTMMAILNRNQELPRDRPELYNQASRVLLHQWDVEQKLLENPRVDSVAIDYKDKQAMLRQVAYHMQAAQKGLAGNLIRGEDLEKILTGYLKSIEVTQARTVARLLIEQLRSRNFILCFLGADSYGFVHRTFLEYFCACEFVERFGKRGLEGGLTLEELKTEVFRKHWKDEFWHEVLRLIAGMIDTSFAGEIIDYLMALDGEAEKFINLFLAAKCLSEVKNRNLIATTAVLLLNRLKYVVQHEFNNYKPSPYQAEIIHDIRTQAFTLIAKVWRDEPNTLPWFKMCTQLKDKREVQFVAIKEFAKHWRDDPDTLLWLRTLAQSDNNISVQKAVGLVLANWKYDPDTLRWFKSCLRSDNSVIRQVAVGEIADGWKDDPDTLPMLKSCIQLNEHWAVKWVAVQALARDWKDDLDTLSMLKSCIQLNEHWAVKRVAVQALARDWKDEHGVFELLHTCAVNDPFARDKDSEDNPRQMALAAIIKQYPGHPQTLPLCKDRAENDLDYKVRGFAVREQARGWKDEPGMFEFLCDRALNDPFERENDYQDNPRQTALEIIIKQYRDRPQTLPLLQDRAENDPDEKVKEFAQKRLAELEK